MLANGRKIITANVDFIDESNIVDILKESIKSHSENKTNIDYLYNYFKGIQPILSRTKMVRPEINNKVVENHANEIVTFKVGYLMGEPVQYVTRNTKEDMTDNINKLNNYMFIEDKHAHDKDIADWLTICGTSYRMSLPNKENDSDSPFKIYTLDPRSTFVVYNTDLANTPLMGVKIITKKIGEEDKEIYCAYTKNEYFEILDEKITKQEGHILGRVPIIEYPANKARLGAFEPVLSLLDTINLVASNRIDGLEQFVQSLMKFKNVDITAEDFMKLKELGAIKIKDTGTTAGDVEFLDHELNQQQTQLLVNHLYQMVLTICGMPNRNGGTSTSDTGAAVIMRDGWSDAEARAKDTELMFKKSEKEFLKIILHIFNIKEKTDLKLSSIEIRFTRRNYENILQKAQVLTLLLGSDKVHPQLAFASCGMFVDSEVAYAKSMQYFESLPKEKPNEATEKVVKKPDE